MAAEATLTRVTSPAFGSIRAFGRLIFAALYFLLARLLAHHGAHGLVSPDWSPLVEEAMFHSIANSRRWPNRAFRCARGGLERLE